MRRVPLLLCLLASAACATTPATRATAQAATDREDPRRALAQPSLSPDGSEIAFVSGGDVWAVPAEGGVARLLVSHEAEESRPLYSPDGERMAFVSNRGGSDDLWVLELGSGRLTRLTWSDGAESLDAWSPDGQWLYFTTGAGDIGGMTDVLRVPSTGGTPAVVSGDAATPEYFAAPSPDGSTLAVSGRARMGFSQWWRNGHSHIDEAEIWLIRQDEEGDESERVGQAVGSPTYHRLTEPGAKNLWALWSADGSSLLFMSDRDGTENLWLRSVAGADPARRVTEFTDGRLLWPSLGNGGRTVVFERDFGIWRQELAASATGGIAGAAGTPRRLDITLRGAAQGPTVEHLELTSDFDDLALSPDGKKVAFVVRGDVFAASAEDGGRAQAVTSSSEPEAEVSWAPDSRRVAYTARVDGRTRVRIRDVVTGAETPLPGSAEGHGEDEASPVFDPDGPRLAYVRGGRELVVADLERDRENVVATGQLWAPPFTPARPLAWSPDGRWLAFFASDDRMFTNVHVVPADGHTAARPISRLANAFAGSLAWAPDGTAVYFDTQHRTEDGQVARVDLVPRTPVFVESEWEALFEEEEREERDQEAERDQPRGGGVVEAAGPVEIEFDGVFQRLELLPLSLDVEAITVSPDGETLVFTASSQGQSNLYAFSLDPLAEEPRVARQLTSSPGRKGLPHFAPDGERVFYLDRGRIASVAVDGGEPETVSLTAELDVDFDREKRVVFDQGWSYLRDHFYDADMHGADWDAIRRDWEPYVAGAETRQELERLMNLMVGELNASHLGHSEPSDGEAETGRLGIRLDPDALGEARFRVAGVIPLGPAHVAGIEPGDHLLAVDGEPLDPGVNLDRLLENRVGDKVVVRLEPADGSATQDVAIQPVSTGTERALAYREWVEHNRSYVDRSSDGRLGYVHMPDMGWGSLQRLMVDLDAENFGREGVVVDVRGNRGGFVNAYALDVFARRGYITMEVRGYPTVPARSMLGQRALERPTVLVTDLNSLSDAEDFTEGYRTLGLGPVVGEPTAGWIIYTWGLRLVDGSFFRMPRSRIRASDGEVMELNPRPVDLRIVRPLGESLSGRDAQLDAAVEALLEKVDASAGR